MAAYYLIATILILGMILSVLTAKLNVSGALLGGVCGMCIFVGAGYTGVMMMAVFFLLGSAATSWKLDQKERSGLAEKNKGRRTAGQVFANAGVAAVSGLAAYFLPALQEVFSLLIAAAFASATADTLSSELGMLYGKRTFNILSMKPDVKGLNGVISIEGTLIGVAGSLVIALVYAVRFGLQADILYIIIAGTMGNLFDSLMGATLERRMVINNNAVNFLNTLFAALVAWGCYRL